MTPGKSLVTGGTGFIGSHLLEALLERGEGVRCLVRERSPRDWIQGLDVELILGDCTDFSSLVPAVKGVDRIYHLAAVTKATDSDAFYRVNTRGTQNLIRACLEANPDVQRVVYLSSLAAVGPCQGENLAIETDPCWPVSHYGRSKREGEEAVLKVRDHLNGVILRSCAVYGPRDRELLPIFRSIRMGVEIGVRGIEQRLSLCYVSDLVSAIVMAGTGDTSSGEIFFVSDGNVYTWQDFGRAIAEALGIRTTRLGVPVSVLGLAAGLFDWISKWSGRPRVFGRERYQEMIQPSWCCDPSKAMSELGFSPSFDLKRGVAATVEWYRAEGWLRN
jgi:nucleoside-diphosphate-sugar epimerase